MRLLKLWLEWDYGQDDMIFNSEEDAKDWMQSMIDLRDFDPEFATVQDIFESGLAGFKIVTLYKSNRK